MAYINPAPSPSPESAAFWQAAKDGRFLIRTCTGCGKAHWYPRPICPFCSSTATEWTNASGRGEIYSFSYLRSLPEPYILAYVTLQEGPTMMTNIVDADPDELSVGQAVEVTFRETRDSDVLVPLFRPAKG